MSETGYITSAMFVQWLKNFICWTRATPEHKVLLIFDGDSTHTQNLEALESKFKMSLFFKNHIAQIFHRKFFFK
jgi:hypothetical protein